VRQAPNSVFQQRFSEVYEETKPKIEQPDTGENLFAMDRGKLFYGFEFDEEAAVDDEIGAEAFVEGRVIIADRHGHLPLHLISSPLQLSREDNFINGFQKTRAQFYVNLHLSIHHILCSPFDFRVHGIT
jgi:hypothetical protein